MCHIVNANQYILPTAYLIPVPKTESLTVDTDRSYLIPYTLYSNPERYLMLGTCFIILAKDSSILALLYFFFFNLYVSSINII